MELISLRLIQISHNIYNLRRQVDDGSAGDSNIRATVGAAKRPGDGSSKVAGDQNCAAGGVDRVDRVAFRRDINDIMRSSGNCLIGNEERLGVDLIVKTYRFKDAEFDLIDVCLVQRRLILVPSSSQSVVVMGCDGGRRCAGDGIHDKNSGEKRKNIEPERRHISTSRKILRNSLSDVRRVSKTLPGDAAIFVSSG